MTVDEADVLARINEGFPEEFWKRYRFLAVRRDSGTLTEQEHQELIGLSDLVETKNTERVPYLVALSERRGLSLQDLILQLGLRPTPISQ